MADEMILPKYATKKLTKKGFIGTDASLDISLFEYSLLWNPKTGQAIYNMGDYFGTSHISKSEIISDIHDAPEGYFSFIGQTKEQALKELCEDDNEYAFVSHISSLDSYQGQYNSNIAYNMDFTELKDFIKELL